MKKLSFSKAHITILLITLFLLGLYNCSDDDSDLTVESKQIHI